jgi:DNA replication protein DnaC
MVMAATAMTKPCSQSGCENEVRVEIPDDLGASWRHFLERLPVMCDTCEAKNYEAEHRREREQRRATYISRVGASKMPRNLIGISFGDEIDREENEDRRKAVEDAEAWGHGEFNGLVLSGPVGVGKSRIAAAAANLRMWSGPLDWVSVPAMMVAIRAGFGTTERDEVTKLLMSRHALVLDDLDKAKPTEFALDVLFQAIEQRTTSNSPLLVTTNLKGDEVEARLNEPIRSRLSGYCRAHWIPGRDRRREPK